MYRKHTDLMLCLAISILIIYVWINFVGVLHAIAIPDDYVKNPDGSYHGKKYVIVIWDLLVVHIPSLIFPCFLLSLLFRLWVVKNSKLIFTVFAAIFLGYYIFTLITQPLILYPADLIQKIYMIIPTPYPILGVSLGIWFGYKINGSMRQRGV